MTRTTTIQRHIDAPPDRVYALLIDPAAIARWRVPEGMSCRIHAHDARVGGAFRVSLTYEAPDAAGKSQANTDTYHGRFVALVPGEAVVEAMAFETRDPALQGEMTLRCTLVPAAGGTLLSVEHAGLPPGVPEADNALGWQMALDKLSALAAGR